MQRPIAPDRRLSHFHGRAAHPEGWLREGLQPFTVSKRTTGLPARYPALIRILAVTVAALEPSARKRAPSFLTFPDPRS